MIYPNLKNTDFCACMCMHLTTSHCYFLSLSNSLLTYDLAGNSQVCRRSTVLQKSPVRTQAHSCCPVKCQVWLTVQYQYSSYQGIAPNSLAILLVPSLSNDCNWALCGPWHSSTISPLILGLERESPTPCSTLGQGGSMGHLHL